MPCFQVQLEASQPKRARRQVNVCAYHVADVIQALRAWAGERNLADGQLTILAIEPSSGGRAAVRSGSATWDGRVGGFAFSTIPLDAAQRREPEPSVSPVPPDGLANPEALPARSDSIPV